MERFLKSIYLLLFVATITNGCRSFIPFSCETYAPEKESLTFINESICVYTQYDIIHSKEYIDSCDWRYDSQNRIVLRREYTFPKDSSYNSNDSIRKKRFNFMYNICPKWYNITDENFMSYIDYKYPLYQEKLSIPYRAPSFYEKYGLKISRDTAIIIGERYLAIRKTKPFYPSFFHTNKTVKVNRVKVLSRLARKGEKQFFSWITNSYEYINYKVNYEKKVPFDQDSIIGKQFSFIGDSCKKENLQFINDSVCTHSFSTRANVLSPFVSQESDSCRYSVKNNLIAIDLVKGKSCDTLTYGNGILFYSKVYKNDKDGELTHIVKPFIDETRSCANKADSINMIMSTYFNVYVPINLYK